MERTFVMIKPDGVARGLTGKIVARFEAKGFTLVRAQLMQVSVELAEKHYAHLKEKPFFGELVDYIISGPVFAMELSATNAIQNARSLIGATNPVNAAAGTIRGDFATDVASNVIHGSDSEESVQIELTNFFGSL
ncbi:nucleoside-diphosphate kinase [Paenibacillus yanchengensis]|uniref:Nucleoside diphosphate kinase n=1 Tax=Paenibacillus yanchengensis TaxID=2035833 RepID=A0ABW4YG06_9BACL